MNLFDRITQAIDNIKRQMDALPDEDGAAYDAWRVLAIQLHALIAEKEKMEW